MRAVFSRDSKAKTFIPVIKEDNATSGTIIGTGLPSCGMEKLKMPMLGR